VTVIANYVVVVMGTMSGNTPFSADQGAAAEP
jgi:hypothetical protein